PRPAPRQNSDLLEASDSPAPNRTQSRERSAGRKLEQQAVPELRTREFSFGPPWQLWFKCSSIIRVRRRCAQRRLHCEPVFAAPSIAGLAHSHQLRYIHQILVIVTFLARSRIRSPSAKTASAPYGQEGSTPLRRAATQHGSQASPGRRIAGSRRTVRH